MKRLVGLTNSPPRRPRTPRYQFGCGKETACRDSVRGLHRETVFSPCGCETGSDSRLFKVELHLGSTACNIW
ncbi:hypothetical protein RRG08_001659 [Elysia crispata]|uniref:Uncharacterized protein n=1 Tax=Elysia crispata TaxID=231223 RepID=A0AAE1E008_9GAST|nr:hypothetical protein RRG08_001659 [Elysia crispata]